jgi:hypothetical protein
MHPHHTSGSDVLSGPEEGWAESVEMVVILPRGYCDVRRDYFDERENKQRSVVRGRRLQFESNPRNMATRAPRRVARKGLSPERCCDMIWRDARI